MLLRRVKEDVYSVLAMCEAEERSSVAEALDEDQCRANAAYAKMLALLTRTSTHGAPKNWERFHAIHKKLGAFEFKTHELRVFCFVDGRRFICTHLVPKNKIKKRDYPAHERIVLSARSDYMADKAANRLQIVD